MKKLLFILLLLILPAWCFAQTPVTPQFQRKIPSDSILKAKTPQGTLNLPDTSWVKKYSGKDLIANKKDFSGIGIPSDKFRFRDTVLRANWVIRSDSTTVPALTLLSGNAAGFVLLQKDLSNVTHFAVSGQGTVFTNEVHAVHGEQYGAMLIQSDTSGITFFYNNFPNGRFWKTASGAHTYITSDSTGLHATLNIDTAHMTAHPNDYVTAKWVTAHGGSGGGTVNTGNGIQGDGSSGNKVRLGDITESTTISGTINDITWDFNDGTNETTHIISPIQNLMETFVGSDTGSVETFSDGTNASALLQIQKTTDVSGIKVASNLSGIHVYNPSEGIGLIGDQLFPYSDDNQYVQYGNLYTFPIGLYYADGSITTGGGFRNVTLNGNEIDWIGDAPSSHRTIMYPSGNIGLGAAPGQSDLGYALTITQPGVNGFINSGGLQVDASGNAFTTRPSAHDSTTRIPTTGWVLTEIVGHSGSTGVTSVSGTPNRITSTGGTTPVIDISSTFEALLEKVANKTATASTSTTTYPNWLGVENYVASQIPSTPSLQSVAGVGNSYTGQIQAQNFLATGTANAGFYEMSTQSASPASVTNHIRLYSDSLNRLSWKNSLYRRTIQVPYPSDYTIRMPYLVTGTTLEDSTHAAGAYATITNLALKAPIASPTFTGTVTIPNGGVFGTPASLTLTNATGLPNAGLVNSSITINGTSIALGASNTVTANTTNALTLGRGLNGSSFTGAGAVTATLDTSQNYIWGKLQTIQKNGIATTATDALFLQNATAATSGTPNQYSPAWDLGAQVWNTTATAANNFGRVRSYVSTTSGTSPAVSYLIDMSLSTTNTPSFSNLLTSKLQTGAFQTNINGSFTSSGQLSSQSSGQFETYMYSHGASAGNGFWLNSAVNYFSVTAATDGHSGILGYQTSSLGGTPTTVASWLDNGRFKFAGNTQYAFVAKTGAYTATATDEIITGDATSAAFNITLPTAVSVSGIRYTVKKIDSSGNAVTVNTTSSQTIDGSTTYVLSAQYKYATFVSNGSNWLIIANN